MKTILCYGDSNTWGWNPVNQTRYARFARWPGVLQQRLGGGYYIIEAGLSGRTTVHDDPIEPHRNGKTYLPACLMSHQPLDLVILMLGTNDLKHRFGQSAFDIAAGAGFLVKLIQQSGTGPNGQSPQVLLLAPPPIIKRPPTAAQFEGGPAKSKQFGRTFGPISRQHHCHFLDTGKVVDSSSIDGVHLELTEHQKLGLALAEKVEQIFSAGPADR